MQVQVACPEELTEQVPLLQLNPSQTDEAQVVPEYPAVHAQEAAPIKKIEKRKKNLKFSKFSFFF